MLYLFLIYEPARKYAMRYYEISESNEAANKRRAAVQTAQDRKTRALGAYQSRLRTLKATAVTASKVDSSLERSSRVQKAQQDRADAASKYEDARQRANAAATKAMRNGA